MRSLSLIVIGLTLASMTAAAEPLRLGDADLDLVTADVRSISVVAQVVQGADYDDLDTNDTVIRILDDSDGEIAFIDARSTTDPEAADVDLAVPVSTVPNSNNDPGNTVGDSDVLIVRGDDLPGTDVVVSGTGVVLFDRGTVAGNDMSTAGARTESRQVVVRTGSADNAAVVRASGSLTRGGNSDRLESVSSSGGARSILVRNDTASAGGGSRATGLFADNGNAGLSTGRLAAGTVAGGFAASAFAGGSVTSILSGRFN